MSGDPLQRAWNYFSSADGRFNAGIWECAVGKWRVIFTESEFCQLLAGVIVVTGDDGSERTVPRWRCLRLARGIHRLAGMCASRRASTTPSTNERTRMPSDIEFMRLALEQARQAGARRGAGGRGDGEGR